MSRRSERAIVLFLRCMWNIYVNCMCISYRKESFTCQGIFFFYLGSWVGGGGRGEGCTTDEKKEFTWCNFTFIVLYLFWNTFLGVIGLCVHHVKSWYHLAVHDTLTELTLIIISYGNKISEVSWIIVLFFWKTVSVLVCRSKMVGHFNNIGLKMTDTLWETKYMKTYTPCIMKVVHVWKKKNQIIRI